MPESLIFTKLEAGDGFEEAIEHLRGRLLEVMDGLESFRDVSMWKDEAGGYLVAGHYASLEGAEQALVRLAQSSLPREMLNWVDGPPDITRVHLHHAHGLSMPQVQIAEFMSLSKRVADPGKGAGLLTELQGIFGELAAIGGYLGSVLGHSNTLQEEVVGLVFWSTKDAFFQSLPRKTLYEVKLYRKIR